MAGAGIVIVGAGECGTRAALSLREAGFDGPVTLAGVEAGSPYERPPLSKPGEGGVQRREIASAARLAAAGIDYRPGVAAVRIDRAARLVELSDGGTLPYAKLLLATGALPRRLPSDPDGHALSLRTAEDAARIWSRAEPGTRAVIVGAGLIGMELAAAFRGRGVAVTVLEMAPRALGRAVPGPLADRIVARHAAEGVDLRTGVGIARVAAGGVTLADGAALPAALVVAAIGVVPDTRLAAGAGLSCGNGVEVDARLCTADPDIFAAGDCAAMLHPRYGRIRFESWRMAQDQGAHAARAMLGAEAAFDAVPWFWSDQYDLGLQVAGLPDPDHAIVRRDVGADAEILFHLSPDGRLAAASGLGPGTAVARDIRLAEMLIAKGIAPDPAALADPGTNLKKLLRA